jgi:hypothetical protein
VSTDLIARKGLAEPAAHHAGDAARFHARRTIVLPAINLHAAGDGGTARGAHANRSAPATGQRRRAASLVGDEPRRKFTFRIDHERHAAFCRAAEDRAISRQRLLTRALDEFLARAGARATGPGFPDSAVADPASA